MTKRIAVAMLLTIGIVANANSQIWKPDKAHSTVAFTVRHMLITKVSGRFGDFDGTINFDGKDFSKGSAEFTIQSKSITTDQEKRDAHLKSPDFFAVDSFPTLTFKSTKIDPVDSTHFKLAGDLTIRGVTKPVTFDCTYNGAQEAFGSTRSAFSATTTINRMDFGVKWDKTLDNGSLIVGKDVMIDLELELVKAKS